MTILRPVGALGFEVVRRYFSDFIKQLQSSLRYSLVEIWRLYRLVFQHAPSRCFRNPGLSIWLHLSLLQLQRLDPSSVSYDIPSDNGASTSTTSY